MKIMRSLTTQLGIFTLLPFAIIAIGILSISAWHSYEQLAKSQNSNRALIESIFSRAAEETLSIGLSDLAQQAVQSLTNSKELAYIEISGNDGRIVFSSKDLKSPQPFHSQSHIQIESRALDLEAFDDAHGANPEAAEDKASHLGSLTLYWSDSNILAQRQQLAIWISLMLFGLMILLLLQALFVRRQVLKPISEIQRGVDQLYNDNYDINLNVSEESEISDLATQIEQLARTLDTNLQERSERESEIIQAHSESDSARIQHIQSIREFLAKIQRPLRVCSQQLIQVAQFNQDANLKSDIKIAVGCVHHGLDLVNELQMFYGNTFQEIPATPYPCHLAALLDRTMATLERSYQAKSCEIESAIIGDRKLLDTLIYLDGRRFKQMAHYLLNAAIDNSVTNKVFFTTYLQQIATQKLLVIFDIKDSGNGLPPEEAESLQLYLDGTSSELVSDNYAYHEISLLRSLKTALNSSIRVSSKLGHGTTFTCEFEIEIFDPAKDLSTIAGDEKIISFVGARHHQRMLEEIIAQTPLQLQCFDSMDDLEPHFGDKPQTLLIDCGKLDEAIAIAQQLETSGLVKLLAANFSPEPLQDEVSYMLFDAGFESILSQPQSPHDFIEQLLSMSSWRNSAWLQKILQQ